ncbi:MAG: acyl-CoA dehydrogenase family protein [Dehalococcoidia bacterium]|nr:acyl-CoA dehydrogenase family protein [Dehalococcoidia bacterium]
MGWEADDEEPDVVKRFREELIRKRWHVLAWPRQYGGLEADYLQQVVYNEEMAMAGAPGGNVWAGVSLVGPVLMIHGSEEQKARFLPGISDATDVWAQGFSEPNAGSDLASLQTRATREGDEYVVNGQKIWTSGAQYADWCILLARTDPDAPKHRGISYFLVDMKSPGFAVRPLTDMSGGQPFNELFFEDVRVPASNVVGELNRGWYMAATTLDFERSGIGAASSIQRELLTLIGDVASWPGHGLRVASKRTQLAEIGISVQVARLLAYRVASMQAHGLVPNYDCRGHQRDPEERHCHPRAGTAAGLVGWLWPKRCRPRTPGLSGSFPRKGRTCPSR